MSRRPVVLLGLTLRQHVGGRWAVSLLLFATYVPLGIVSTIGNLSTAVPGTSLGRILFASAMSLAPVGLILWLSDLTWLRDRREHPAPVISIVLLGAVIGLARSASMYLLSLGLGIQDADASLAWARMVTGALQGAAIYPLGVLAFSLVATYREQRRQLIQRQIAWETRRLEDARQWDQLRTEVIAPITDELEALGDDLDREVINADAAADAVRERAHALWGDAQPSPVVPRVRLSATLAASLKARPFATWLVLAVWLPSVLGTTLAVGPIPRAPLGALLAALAIAVTFESANALVARWPRTWWVALPVGLGVAITISSPAVGIFGAPLARGTAEYTAVNAMWLVLLVTLSSIVIGALRRGEEILVDLHASVDATSVETLAQEEQRRRIIHDVASTLHGSLQGRLASIPETATAGDAVRETLALLQAGSGTAASAPLSDVAARGVQAWQALLDIAIDSPDDVVDARVAQAVADALEECAANAFRHGRATRLDCRITCVAGQVQLTIRDDGRASTSSSATPGLGSRILDRCGTWTRVQSEHGSTVSISIQA